MLNIEEFIPTSPEQQAGVCLHGAARTAPQFKAKAQGPFSGEGEGMMTLQQGTKGPGLTSQGRCSQMQMAGKGGG